MLSDWSSYRRAVRRMIRRECQSSNGWNNADIDTAIQLFRAGLVWDGDICSKESRDHFLRRGYAVYREGFTALTGCGSLRMLCHPRIWLSVWRRWRRHGHFALVPQAKNPPRDQPVPTQSVEEMKAVLRDFTVAHGGSVGTAQREA